MPNAGAYRAHGAKNVRFRFFLGPEAGDAPFQMGEYVFDGGIVDDQLEAGFQIGIVDLVDFVFDGNGFSPEPHFCHRSDFIGIALWIETLIEQEQFYRFYPMLDLAQRKTQEQGGQRAADDNGQAGQIDKGTWVLRGI